VYFHKLKPAIARSLPLLMSLALFRCALIGGGTEIEHTNDFSISEPKDWKRRSSGDSDRAYLLPSGAIANLTSSCHRNPDAPLEVLTRHLLMGTRDVTVKAREKKKLGTNEGLYSKLTARLEGKLFYLEVFVLTKHQCVFDFSLMSTRELSPADTASFHQFIEGFRHGKD
jgi:hypothetical protein